MITSYQIFEIVKESKLLVYRDKLDEQGGEYDSEEKAIEALQHFPSNREFIILKKYRKDTDSLNKIEFV